MTRKRTLLAVFSCAIGVAFAAANVGLARATTRTFSFTHTEQVFTVPAGVTSIHAIAIGGHGGKGDLASNNGGAAAMASGDLGVTPGQTLYVEVGGVGGNAGFGAASIGGWNGGGPGFTGGGVGGGPGSAATDGGGGGGGGSSDIRTLSYAAGVGTSLNSRLITAAGGGGGGGLSTGGAGGAAGNSGSNGSGGGAGGGAGQTTTGGGVGGNGSMGTLGTGGAGGNATFMSSNEGAGGGGGGGTYGGGGGGAGSANGFPGGGGGGGSSSFSAGVANQVLLLDSSGTPSITLTYNNSSGEPSGERAAALASCKKRAHKHHWSHKRLKKCKKKASLLPV